MTVVEEITTRVAALPDDGQREVLDFVEFIGRKRANEVVLERAREIMRQARERNAGVPEEVLNREIEEAIDEVRQQGRARLR
jgi:hypothetical protein